MVHTSLFRKQALISSLYVLVGLVGMAGVSAAQGKQARAKPSGVDTKSLTQSRLTKGGEYQPGSFKTNIALVSMARNYRALGGAPETDIPANIETANLPEASGKKYGAPGLSRVRFLAPPKFQPALFRDFKAGPRRVKVRGTLPSSPGNNR
jgi:hypothetical protein